MESEDKFALNRFVGALAGTMSLSGAYDRVVHFHSIISIKILVQFQSTSAGMSPVADGVDKSPHPCSSQLHVKKPTLVAAF
jgi:hypothetical protein